MDHNTAQPTQHSYSSAEWCSNQSADEQLPGTAAQQRYWVLLEHPAAWSRDILDGHVFGEELTDKLRAHLAHAEARLLLIRRPGREGQHFQRRRVYLIDSAPGRSSVRTVEIDEPADLLCLDLHTGELDPTQPTHTATPSAPRTMSGPVVLVCTHGKRDQCCAVRGRPVAAKLSAEVGEELAAADPASRVWETSHTGGHRFAPVMLVMGAGLTYGSFTDTHYVEAVRAVLRGKLTLTGYRGRSAFTATEQVAEVAIRSRLEAEATAPGAGTEIDSLSMQPDASTVEDNEATIAVRHQDGRTWHVDMRRRALPSRPASCGAAPKPASTWDVVDIREAQTSH